MRKSLGSKRKEISSEQSDQIFNIYQRFEEGEFCKIFPNNLFGYTKVVIEQPLNVNGEWVINKKGEKKPDTLKRDFERIPLTKDIDEYFKKEVKPNLEEAWMDRTKDKIGYEINFTKYFYKFESLRSCESIQEELLFLDKEIKEIRDEIF